jgi:DNA-binding transcriptional MerR regulator
MTAAASKVDLKAPLPPIPAKRYFTIGEVSELCGVKPHVLRYWEQEFTQLRPMKRRGNRRYYQHHEVLLVRRIRDLLYEQGFTISGARNRLGEAMQGRRRDVPVAVEGDEGEPGADAQSMQSAVTAIDAEQVEQIRTELLAAAALLRGESDPAG